MVLPIVVNNNMPKIRSVISQEIIEPSLWIDEIIKDGKNDLETTIENYEVIIACLFKAISAFYSEKSIINRIDEIYKRKDDFLRKYFNSNEEHENFLYIIHFIEMKKNYQFHDNNYGLIKFCESWNMYYQQIFGESESYLTGDALKPLSKGLENIKDYTVFNEKIKIPKINYDYIVNLLDFLNREKINFFQDKGINRRIIKDKNYYITEKRYSDYQKELVYYCETYFHIVESLQILTFPKILGHNATFLKNINSFFYLYEKRSFFCDIVEAYHKKYFETYYPNEEILGIKWEKFSNSMKYKDGSKLNLSENANTSKRNHEYNTDIDIIVNNIYEYIIKPENNNIFPLPEKKDNRSPIIGKNS